MKRRKIVSLSYKNGGFIDWWLDFKSEGFNNNGISTENLYVSLEMFVLKYSEAFERKYVPDFIVLFFTSKFIDS
jgi:hypothetical protein